MFTIGAQAAGYRVAVELRDDDPQTIIRGGLLRIETDAGHFVGTAMWNDGRGITNTAARLGESETKSQELYAELETILHDTATQAIAIARVARHHKLTREAATEILLRLVDIADTDAWEAVAVRPHCLVSWTDPQAATNLAGATGWLFWWEDSGAAVSVIGDHRQYFENVRTVREAQSLAAGFVRCQCGEVTGTRCEQFRRQDEMLLVEWMPYQHRASHKAAGNCGTYPSNGALRLLCAADCAALLVQNEDGWAHPVKGDS